MGGKSQPQQESKEMNLPSRDSAVVRAFRVLVYNVIPSLLVLATNPEVIKSVQNYTPWLLPIIITGAPIVSLIYNTLRKDVPNWGK